MPCDLSGRSHHTSRVACSQPDRILTGKLIGYLALVLSFTRRLSTRCRQSCRVAAAIVLRGNASLVYLLASLTVDSVKYRSHAKTGGISITSPHLESESACRLPRFAAPLWTHDGREQEVFFLEWTQSQPPARTQVSKSGQVDLTDSANPTTA